MSATKFSAGYAVPINPHAAPLSRTIGRGAAVAGAIALCFIAPDVGCAADVTAYDVTSKLFKAKPGLVVDLSNSDLSSLDLAGLDFKAASLAKSNLYGVDLSSANLQGSNLAGAKLDRAILVRTIFSNANLDRASILAPSVFSNVTFDHAEAPKFDGATLRGTRIAARMDGAVFRNADLSGARIGPNERSAEAGMAPATRMMGSDFSGAKMVDIHIQDVDFTFARFVGADLRGAKLIDLNLSRTDFSGADVTGADFSGSNLEQANFKDVKGFDTVKGLNSVTNLATSLR